MTKFIKKLNLERRLRVMKCDRNGFHAAMAWTMFCSRVLCLLPISGIRHPSSHRVSQVSCSRCTQLSNQTRLWRSTDAHCPVVLVLPLLAATTCQILREKPISSGGRLQADIFSMKSFYTIFYIPTFIGQIVLSVMSFLWLFENGVTLPNVTNALFYGSSLVTSGILLNLSRHWPKFISNVEELEGKLPPFTRDVRRLCNITAFVILFMALVEHGLSVMYGYAIAVACKTSEQGELFFIYNMPWIFNHISFALWKGILVEIFNIQSTFMWSYNDLLVMVVSIYLAEHFILHYELLNKSLKQPDIFRGHYLRINKLVNLFNRRFGIFIMTSFAFNLYWICTQLFYSLNKTNTGHIIALDCKSELFKETLHGIEHMIYFSYSFFFLVARTLLVLLLAARVNSTSTAPLMLLYDLPNDKFDVETERFVDQINNLRVAMSGHGFFYVTRTMILTLLGSIITYELVLLQFNK